MFRHGKLDNGLFLMVFDRSLEKLEIRLADFLRYEPRHGRRTIVAAPPDVDIDSLVRHSLETYSPGSFLTPDQSRWLVHSTPLECWEDIAGCGELRSLADLRRSGKNIVSIGREQLKEPDDYAEYAMLGSFDHIGCEHVVASHKRGEIFTDEDVCYSPGVRLYFDGHRIIRDGLAVWDGIHFIKVHHRIPLEPYLLKSITAKDVDAKRNDWTPRTFLEAANQCFLSQVR